MIKTLYAENYKSFPKMELEISNVNILLGANSCGKSSITNLLLMLSQTADAESSVQSAFRLNSSKTSLGEAINIFPEKNKDKVITLGWSLMDEYNRTNKFTLSELYDYIDRCYREFFHKIRRIERSNKHDNERELIHDMLLKAMKHISGYYLIFDENEDECSIESESYKNFEEVLLKNLRSINKLLKKVNENSDTDLKFEIISPVRLTDFINTIKDREAYSKKFSLNKVEYKISYNKIHEECELKQFVLYDSFGKVYIKVDFSDKNRIDVSSEVINNERIKKSRLDIVKDISKLNLNLLDRIYFNETVSNPFSHYIRLLISSNSNEFLNRLSGANINHVSPLRAFPQRYYLLEKSAKHSILNANDGSQLAEILKNNPLILRKVNQLFKEFGIEISTAKTNDIIHRITVKQNNVTVELTDVGFGISQVLPILVQALLCSKNSITIIEQPEIHLHPRMQAWLINAIVKISIKDNKKFIIETHSDTIIKRLQLLMLDPEINFNPENLNLYNLERKGNGHTSIKNIPFNDLGEIEWPDGFMDQEIQDAIKLQELKVKKLRESRDFTNAN